MNTTNYILELMIAGVGTITWIFWMVLTCTGMNLDLKDLQSIIVLEAEELALLVAFLLPFIYTAGVVADRIVDYLFDFFFRDNIIRSEFKDTLKTYESDSTGSHPKEIYNACVATIFLESPSLKETLDYQRTKIRICRAWSVNSLLILIFHNTYLWFHYPNNSEDYIQYAGLFTLIWSASTLLSYFAWSSLTRKECSVVRINAEIIEKRLRSE